MTLGEKIEKQRQDKNLSQKELAEFLNKKTTDIALWESDEVVPSVSDLAKIGAALDVSLDRLMEDVNIIDESMNSSEEEKDIENSKEHIPPNPTLSTDKNRKKHTKKKAVFLTLFLLALAGVAIAFIFFNPFRTFSKDTKAIEKAAASVVKIYCYDYDGNEAATGSGFLAFDDRTVVTNYHVMEEAYTLQV